MRLTLERDNDNFKMELNGEYTFEDLFQILLNGMKSVLDETVKKVSNEKNVEEVKSQLHDLAVTAFSSMIVQFDPKSEHYERV